MTHYATLGIDPTATEDQVHAAYAELSDWLSSADGYDHVMYDLVREAYLELSDPTSRAAYDRALIDEAAQPTEQLPPPGDEGIAVPADVPLDPDVDVSGDGPRFGLNPLVEVIGWRGIAGLILAASLAGWFVFRLTGDGADATFVYYFGAAILGFLVLRIFARMKA